MGYAYYMADGRECGYAVDAICDREGCDTEIHRGLAYSCGDYPGEGEDFCGGYFCYFHLTYLDGVSGQRCEECADYIENENP